MKRKITSGTKFSDSKKQVQSAITTLLRDSGWYWVKSPASKKKEHFQDRVDFTSIVTLTDILKLDAITDWHERVKLKEKYIRRNPGIVFRDYAEHIPLELRPVTSSWSGIRRLIKVSTEGEVVSVGRDGMRSLKNPAESERDVVIVRGSAFLLKRHLSIPRLFLQR